MAFRGAILRSGLPARYLNSVASTNADWNANVAAIVGGLDGDGMLAVLVGNRGTGKTQAAAEAIKAACETWAVSPCRKRTIQFGPDSEHDITEKTTDTPALYRTAMQVFSELRAGFGKAATTTEAAAMKPLLEARLLVIDEAQERGETDFEDRVLTHLIDRRYADMRDTILICNLTPGDVQRKLGPSILDRAAQCGGIIEFKGESFRRTPRTATA